MTTTQQGGASLLDALVALSFLVTLACLAAPLEQLIEQQQLRAAASELTQMTHQARAYALSNNTRTTLCYLDQDQRCSSQWQTAISVFTDSNGNRRLDNQEQLLSFSRLKNIQLIWRGMAPANSLHFNGNGHTFVSNGTFTLCHPHLTQGRKLIINRQGRLRSENSSTPCEHD
ncbi:GspH/FimT family pseudopilin [Atopomonas sediminilitoris]|uniref:GspH/FimT family pseudopilin n=1 Tax=Atopomonas sediminilitoris TaxID=2919919 RepID=UPI001F4DFFCC|nr:GspH/FimT family pseudopilin [Atopomonas sediminilitoris]MCJ8170660.1 GspH/FimT family pseudopilin [Atopomonas sediminilitoris]